jgi:hypothetical protein
MTSTDTTSLYSPRDYLLHTITGIAKANLATVFCAAGIALFSSDRPVESQDRPHALQPITILLPAAALLAAQALDTYYYVADLAWDKVHQVNSHASNLMPALLYPAYHYYEELPYLDAWVDEVAEEMREV